MNVKEFMDFGYLAEVNREYLHPLGLALQVKSDENGRFYIDEVLECPDPSGWTFDTTSEEYKKKAEQVDKVKKRMYNNRMTEYEFIIQPLDTKF